jgi:hypothetical protein
MAVEATVEAMGAEETAVGSAVGAKAVVMVAGAKVGVRAEAATVVGWAVEVRAVDLACPRGAAIAKNCQSEHASFQSSMWNSGDFATSSNPLESTDSTRPCTTSAVITLGA